MTRPGTQAEFDTEAWGPLYSHRLAPFPKPARGTIAVKVINDYGEEVMKAHELA